jgi:uncharacterized protein
MPRKFFKKIMPDPYSVREHKCVKIFGSLLNNINLWHFNRRSLSGAAFVGFFCAFMPIPFQMFLAACLAILFSTNLPLSVSIVWITNPVTMPPMFYFAYVVGREILDTPPQPFSFDPTFEWLSTMLGQIWQPFLLGCFICGICSGLIAYLFVQLIWRFLVIRRFRNRHRRK